MSIRFICGCGKHLRARDVMALRRSMCPRCGAPVGIPSLQPTHPGTLAAPLTPQERRRLNRETAPADDATKSDTTAARITDAFLTPPFGEPIPLPWTKRHRRRQPRNLETHWYECFSYPFLNWRVICALAMALTALSGSIVLSIPELPPFSEIPHRQWILYAMGGAMALLILAYTCGSVECALTSALAGAGGGVYWPARQAGLALKSGLRWLICFLAGPIVPAAIAGYFWLYGGELTGLDWAILTELLVLTIASWFLSIVTANESGRLRDANPLRVAQLAHRLRFRAIVPVLVAPALGLAHGLVGIFALTELHPRTGMDMLLGLLLLPSCWISGLFWAMFFFRLLGVWCYRIPASRGHQGPSTGLG